MSFDPKARSFVLKIQNSGSPSSYDTLGAIVDCTHTVTDPPDDTTSKGSGGARELYSDGCVTAHDFSGNLVVSNETAYATLLAAKFSTSPKSPKVNAQVVGPTKTFTGVFHIETLTKTGGNAGRVRASIDLKSSGVIAVSNT